MIIQLNDKQVADDICLFFLSKMEGRDEPIKDGRYVIFNDWLDKKGQKIKLILDANVFYQSARQHGTGVMPKAIKDINEVSPTFIFRLWCRIKGIDFKNAELYKI